MTHDDLVRLACSWLRRKRRLPIVLGEFRSIMMDEFPDAIGWNRSAWSVVIECKASRSDFLRDAKKRCRLHPERAMGSERFYLSEPGVVGEEDLPDGWGLLWAERGRVRVVRNAARGSWTRDARAHQAETIMLLAVIHRAIRGPEPRRVVRDLGRVLALAGATS